MVLIVQTQEEALALGMVELIATFHHFLTQVAPLLTATMATVQAATMATVQAATMVSVTILMVLTNHTMI